MPQALDLGRYLARIGWTGSTSPSFATLAGLLQAHMARIPFENIDVLLGRPIRLDLEGVQTKLVSAQRGGYCFEHATLFAAVLEQLGFEVVRHTARVVLMAPRTQSARAHMFLLVLLTEGTFVIDPGFGGLAARKPLPLIHGREVDDGVIAHAMVKDGEYWVFRMRRGDEISDGWVTTLDPDNIIDFEVGNHFMSTHPASTMRNNIMLNALQSDGRVSVMNRDVTIRRGATIEKTVLADRRELRSLIARYFGFDLPEVETLKVPAIPEWS